MYTYGLTDLKLSVITNFLFLYCLGWCSDCAGSMLPKVLTGGWRLFPAIHLSNVDTYRNVVSVRLLNFSFTYSKICEILVRFMKYVHLVFIVRFLF